MLKSLSASMIAQDNRGVIGGIGVTVTYFYGVPGSLFSPELAEWYGEKVKTAFKAVAFPDSTHMFISEHLEKFAEELGKLV